MISETLKQLVNYRINQEEFSARLYHAMELWLDDKAFLGAAKLYKRFEEEEYKHAYWAMDYLLSIKVKPEVQQIAEPQNNFNSLHDIIYKTLEHEKLITKQCEELAKAALKEMDLKVFDLAQRYIHEQIEELNKAFTLVDLANNYGQERLAIMELDEKLGEMAEDKRKSYY